MDPVLGGVVIEREEHIDVVGDLRRGFGPLRPVSGELNLVGTLLNGRSRVSPSVSSVIYHDPPTVALTP